ncbi:MAG: acetyl-CoA C-acyltransferase [Pseudomonadota bacterium]
MGGFQGDFANVKATELGARAIESAVEDAGVSGEAVDAAIMGCVLPAGLGQAPARQSTLGAGLGLDVSATTINKMCGSGMKAVMDAHDQIAIHSADFMIAGGMESMSRAPYLLPDTRTGMRFGHGQVMDHMALDGLEDAYEPGRAMGTFAEDCAEKYQFTRDAQDAYAIESLKRAQEATKEGWLKDEIAPVTVKTRKGETIVDEDEQPGKARLDKIPHLRPAFRKEGTVTAANASSISDGAAALVLTRASVAKAHGLTPMARIHGHATHAQAPNWFTTAPIGAVEKLYQQTGWSREDVELFEVNEAFAVVAMAAMRDLQIDHNAINIHGGACALGHPIGASGARIIVTLLGAMKRLNKTRGVAAICIGGGEATAIAIERLN